MKKKSTAAAVAAVSDKAKEKSRKKLRTVAIVLSVLVLLAILLTLINALYCPLGYLWVKFSNPEIVKRVEGELRVHFVDVGQGDAAIIELPDGKTMLIDGGDESHSSKRSLLRYANALGVGKFDYVLVSHPDEDHAGGIDDVIRCFGAEKAFIPYYTSYEKDSSFAEVLDTLAKEKCETEVSERFDVILPETEEYFYYLTFLSPYQSGIPGSYYDAANSETATDTDVNNISAVVWLEYAGRSILFTGDITEKVEADLLEEYETLGANCFSKCVETAWGDKVTVSPDLGKLDFLKAAHHGSAASTCEKFLELTSPEAAFISVGAGNAYGHPSQETVARLVSAGADIYRTDELGSILLTIGKDGEYRIDYARAA